jgi:hypothetical protein
MFVSTLAMVVIGLRETLAQLIPDMGQMDRMRALLIGKLHRLWPMIYIMV